MKGDRKRGKETTARHRRRSALGLACAAVAAFSIATADARGASFAYAVNNNAGTLSAFSVDPLGPLLALSPASVSTGTFPETLVVSPDGRSLYVPASGAGTLSQYTIEADGALTAKAPATVGPLSQPYAVAVSPDGRSVYVTVKGTNAVAQFDVGEDGTLSAKAPATVPTGSNPWAIALAPDGRSAYVASADGAAVHQYDVGADGALAAKSVATVSTGSTPRGIAVTPDGGSVYVANFSGGSVSQYDVGADGALAPKSPATVAAGAGAWSTIVSPDGRSLYVANFSGGSVSQYDIAAADGALAPKAPATVATAALPLLGGLRPDGGAFYLASFGSASVWQATVGPGGALTAMSPASVSTGAGTQGVVVTPSQPPTAALTVTPAAAGAASAFDASLSAAVDRPIASYSWDFGDGATATGSAPTVEHVYAAPGSYTATVAVADDLGCSTSPVYTGQMSSCNGGEAALATRTVVVAGTDPLDPARPPPVPTPRVRRITVTETLITPSIGMFGARQTKLARSGRVWIRAVAKHLRGATRVRCEGHNDRLGAKREPEARRLGLTRARNVCRALAGTGMKARWTATSLGSSQPRASNRTRRGKWMNRRVEVRFWTAR